MGHANALFQNIVLSLVEGILMEVIKNAELKHEKLRAIIQLLEESYPYENYLMKNQVTYKTHETRELKWYPESCIVKS